MGRHGSPVRAVISRHNQAHPRGGLIEAKCHSLHHAAANATRSGKIAFRVIVSVAIAPINGKKPAM